MSDTNSVDKNEIIRRLLTKVKTLKYKIEHEKNDLKGDIAIIGLGFRFPDNTKEMELFTNDLLHGKDYVGVIPDSRWDHNQFYDTTLSNPLSMYTKWAAFLSDYDLKRLVHVLSVRLCCNDYIRQILLKYTITKTYFDLVFLRRFNLSHENSPPKAISLILQQ